MDVEKKLDMSLDEISEKNHSGGKARNSRKVRGGDRFMPYKDSPRRAKQQQTKQGSKGALSKRVYVGNLSWDVKWQDLKDHMKQAGDVVHADVIEAAGGRSKGCGIVEYKTVDEAEEAIATLNDTELSGRLIFVREDREASSTSISNQNASSNGGHNSQARVYVGNLSWNISWQDLKDHMKQAGNVIHCDVLKGSDGRSKGCGLVEFSSKKDAQNAITQLHDTDLGGRTIFVREDREPESGSISSIAKRAAGGGGAFNRNKDSRRKGSDHGNDGGSKQLYVGNLSWEVKWQDLKDLFREIGDVERAEIAEYPDGKSRGFGIVKFFSPEDAKRAIAELNNVDFNGRQIEVRSDRRP